MASTVCLSCVNSISSPSKPSVPPSLVHPNSNISVRNPTLYLHSLKPTAPRTSGSRFHSLRVKAADSNPSTKPNSIVCADCDGNGAILCTQCKGTGVNSVDHFNGQFKAGALCWLCSSLRLEASPWGNSLSLISEATPVRNTLFQAANLWSMLVPYIFLEG